MAYMHVKIDGLSRHGKPVVVDYAFRLVDHPEQQDVRFAVPMAWQAVETLIKDGWKLPEPVMRLYQKRKQERIAELEAELAKLRGE